MASPNGVKVAKLDAPKVPARPRKQLIAVTARCIYAGGSMTRDPASSARTRFISDFQALGGMKAITRRHGRLSPSGVAWFILLP